MQYFKLWLLFVWTMLLSSGLHAYTPPIPPPDPVRLAASLRLVEILPVEAAAIQTKWEISREVEQGALEWFRNQSGAGNDEVLERLFSAKVRLEINKQFNAAVRDIKSIFAERYARRLTEQEIVSVEAFASTLHGKKFLQIQLQSDRRLTWLVTQRLNKRLREKLPGSLESALASKAILEQVNQAQ